MKKVAYATAVPGYILCGSRPLSGAAIAFGRTALAIMTALLLVSCGAAHPISRDTQDSGLSNALSSAAQQATQNVLLSLHGAVLKNGEKPVVMIGRSGALPDWLVWEVSEAVDKAGFRQAARGEFLTMTIKAQSQLQEIIYEPRERALLKGAEVIIAMNGEVNGSGLLLKAGAVALRPLSVNDGVVEPGELVPGSSVSIQVLFPGGTLVTGTGFCNKELATSQWRYSAERAALLNAQAERLYMEGGSVTARAGVGELPVLGMDVVTARSQGARRGWLILGKSFQPKECSAKILVWFPSP